MALPLSTEPRDLLLDATGNLVVTTDLQFSRGLQAIVQSCRIALRLFEGEWFLNLDAGIPYRQSLLGKKSKGALESAKLAFREALELIVGVVRVVKLDADFDNHTRRMSINWIVATAFGDSDLNKVVFSVARSVA